MIRATVLIAMLLAGCAGPTDPLTDDAPVQAIPAGAHPAYGFPTQASLEGDDVPDAWRLPDVPADAGLTALVPIVRIDGQAHGLAVWGHHLYAGGQAGGLQVINIMDAGKAEVVGSIDLPARDISVIAYPDGRVVLVTVGGGDEMFAINVTDPSAPELLSTWKAIHQTHNIAVVPGTPLAYNAGFGGDGTDIWDLSDPTQPVLAADFPSGTCHDITFYVGEEKQRAYCAKYGSHEIWDIADPMAPEILGEFDMPFELGLDRRLPGTLDHSALVNHDGTVLIIGDEAAGGAAPACFGEHHIPDGTRSGAHGSLWFYDITDETAPVLRSWIGAPPTAMDGICTSHFGKIIGDSNHLVMSWYSAGTTLIDFTDLDHPTTQDHFDPYGPQAALNGHMLAPSSGIGGTWEALEHRGYVFSSDQAFGLQVFARR